MRVVHIQTQIQTLFGIEDDNGDIVQKIPVQAEVTRFTASGFAEAHTALFGERTKIIKKLPPDDADDIPQRSLPSQPSTRYQRNGLGDSLDDLKVEMGESSPRA